MYMRTVASWDAIIECIQAENENLRRGAGYVPVLVQKADHPRPTRFNVTGFVLHARLCNLARVVVSSDGDDSAETLALGFQPFLYEALRSMLRNLSFYGVILRIFPELSKFRRSEFFENVVECWRRRWRGRGRSGFARRQDAVLSKGFVAGKSDLIYTIGRI
jgi:hypothetical protein